MSDIFQPMRLSVEKDLSGGVKIAFGASVGLLTREQTFEFAMVLLKAAGLGTELAEQLPSQKHFRPG